MAMLLACGKVSTSMFSSLLLHQLTSAVCQIIQQSKLGGRQSEMFAQLEHFGMSLLSCSLFHTGRGSER